MRPVLFSSTLVLALSAFPLDADSLAYTLTDLGPGQPVHINDRGEVIGLDANSSFFYNGVRQLIPNPAGATFRAEGISGNQVVGTVIYPNFSYNIGLYAGGSVQSVLGGTDRSGHVINDAGQIAGDSVSYRSYLLSGGTYTTINPLPGDFAIATRAINQSGDVLLDSIGNSDHAVIFSHGTLSPVPGSAGLNLQPSDFNNAGQVVGSTGNGLAQAFVLSNGTFQLLGVLPGALTSFANAVNDSGTIVGTTQSSRDAFATAYYPGSGWVNLNSVVTNNSGWTLILAADINNAGQIVGFGTHNGVGSAYLLTPVPEPAVMPLVGITVLSIALQIRRQRLIRKG